MPVRIILKSTIILAAWISENMFAKSCSLVFRVREGRISKTHRIPVTITEINARIFP